MLRSRQIWDVPTETSRIAHNSLPKGNEYLTLRDNIGVIYQDETFAELFVWRGQPAESPGLLAMVTIMQFAEGLTDRQAAEAVGSRIDWKYVLGLAIDAPGLSHSVLNEFRGRLLEDSQEQLLFETLVDHLKEQGWFKGSRRQRTDSTHVLAAVRDLNRLEFVGETLRAALNDLATVVPEWLVWTAAGKLPLAPDQNQTIGFATADWAGWLPVDGGHLWTPGPSLAAGIANGAGAASGLGATILSSR